MKAVMWKVPQCEVVRRGEWFYIITTFEDGDVSVNGLDARNLEYYEVLDRDNASQTLYFKDTVEAKVWIGKEGQS